MKCGKEGSSRATSGMQQRDATEARCAVVYLLVLAITWNATAACEAPQAQLPVLDLSLVASSSAGAVTDFSDPTLGAGNSSKTFLRPHFMDSRNKTYPVSACIWECKDFRFNCKTGLQAAANAFCRHVRYYRAYPTENKGWKYTKSGSTQGSYINKLYFKNGTFQKDDWLYCKNCGWIFTSITCDGTR